MLNQLSPPILDISRPILDRKQTENLHDKQIFYYIVPSTDPNENELGYKIVSSTPYIVNQLEGSALFHLDVPPSLERASWLIDIEGNLVGIFTGRFSENNRKEEIHWCTFISNKIDKDILKLLQRQITGTLL